MCLLLFAYNFHPKHRLILAANRDEFYQRPTAPAQFWKDAPEVLAGRDLVQGGSWLGVTRTGRLAAVTNFRDPNQPKGEFSRGNLVADFLRGTDSVSEYLNKVKNNAENYTGFNLLVGEFGQKHTELAYFSNRGEGIKILVSGIYGLSNALLDTPWPKVVQGKENLAKIVEENVEGSPNPLFELMQTSVPAEDKYLPETGIGLERERILSACFIETPIYGTRCSSVVLIGNDNSISFSEASFHPSLGRMNETFQII